MAVRQADPGVRKVNPDRDLLNSRSGEAGGTSAAATRTYSARPRQRGHRRTRYVNEREGEAALSSWGGISPAFACGSASSLSPAGANGQATDALAIGARPALLPAHPAAQAEAAQAVRTLYEAQYRPLVRLAVLLMRDSATAEDVVQEAFVGMYTSWGRLRHSDNALAYLRRSVVNRSRSVLRHRVVEDKYAPKPPPDAPSAEEAALTAVEGSAVVAALRGLPRRQREVLLLRYYADLSEADIANAMGVSRGAVKSHTARGMSALRAVLEQTTAR